MSQTSTRMKLHTCSGDAKKNLHLALLLGGGNTQMMLIFFINNSGKPITLGESLLWKTLVEADIAAIRWSYKIHWVYIKNFKYLKWRNPEPYSRLFSGSGFPGKPIPWFCIVTYIKTIKINHSCTPRIMGSLNWWFGDPSPVLYTSKTLYSKVQWFLG